MTEPESPGQPLAVGSAEPLAARHDVALLDLDGVLYVGADAVAGAPDALVAAAKLGMRAAFVTNNASRTPGTVAAHLREIGIGANPDDVVTSAQAAARLVAAAVAPGSPVLVVGGDGLVEALREHGLVPVFSAEEDVAAVAQGFAPEIDWRLLAEGAYAVGSGVPWFATNMDATVPTPRGRAPGNGTLVEAIARATGRKPVVAGKPEPPLHEESVRRTGARTPIVVGDRLDTDIEGATRAGVPSLLVLTGVTAPDELVRAPKGRRPTYVATDLDGGLLQPHPPVASRDDHHDCGGWTVSWRSGEVAASGSGDRVDGLRALAVAAWNATSSSGDDPEQVAVAAALEQIGW